MGMARSAGSSASPLSEKLPMNTRVPATSVTTTVTLPNPNPSRKSGTSCASLLRMWISVIWTFVSDPNDHASAEHDSPTFVNDWHTWSSSPAENHDDIGSSSNALAGPKSTPPGKVVDASTIPTGPTFAGGG